MRRILKHPAVNAMGLGVFSAFYAVMFLRSPAEGSGTGEIKGFWAAWQGFLAVGHQRWIAWSLVALTALVIVLLLTRRRPYDEYHTGVLMQCLAAAAVLILLCIAAFFLVTVLEPGGFQEKFMLFIAVHWITVVLADLAYVLICGWR